jgi:hypothetical protein
MKESRILFLDIDGVINSHQFWDRLEQEGHKQDDLHNFDPVAIEWLNYIHYHVKDFKVVISSTWKHHIESSVGWNIIFQLLGGHFYVADVTRDLDGFRGSEIASWLIEAESSTRRHPNWDHYGDIKSFAILDDDSDMDSISNRLVHVDGKVGLQKETADQVIEMLNEDVVFQYGAGKIETRTWFKYENRQICPWCRKETIISDVAWNNWKYCPHCGKPTSL